MVKTKSISTLAFQAKPEQQPVTRMNDEINKKSSLKS